MPVRVEEWEADMGRFKDAGGAPPTDEDLGIIMMDMLPDNLPVTFISELRGATEIYEQLRARIEGEVEDLRSGASKLSTGKAVMTADYDKRSDGSGEEFGGQRAGDHEHMLVRMSVVMWLGKSMFSWNRRG